MSQTTTTTQEKNMHTYISFLLRRIFIHSGSVYKFIIDTKQAANTQVVSFVSNIINSVQQARQDKTKKNEIKRR